MTVTTITYGGTQCPCSYQSDGDCGDPGWTIEVRFVLNGVGDDCTVGFGDSFSGYDDYNKYRLLYYTCVVAYVSLSFRFMGGSVVVPM